MSVLKKRTISVENMQCDGCEHTIEDSLRGLDGIREVEADHQRGMISVAYDLMKVDLTHIEEQIGKMGYTIHENLFARLKHRYIHFTEENERDNLNAPPPPCCTNPDSLLRKRGKHV